MTIHAEAQTRPGLIDSRSQSTSGPNPKGTAKLWRELRVQDPESPTNELLKRLGKGDRTAENELYPRVLAQLTALATRRMSEQPDCRTLEPEALINEVFLRLTATSRAFADRNHFIATAARAMRQVIKDYWKARLAIKRDPPGDRVPLESLVDQMQSRVIDFVALDEALQIFAGEDSVAAKLIELQLFGGQTLQAAARMLGLSDRTASRKKDLAKARLYQLIHSSPTDL